MMEQKKERSVSEKKEERYEKKKENNWPRRRSIFAHTPMKIQKNSPT
jgi:hypothetical protein